MDAWTDGRERTCRGYDVAVCHPACLADPLRLLREAGHPLPGHLVAGGSFPIQQACLGQQSCCHHEAGLIVADDHPSSLITTLQRFQGETMTKGATPAYFLQAMFVRL